MTDPKFDSARFRQVLGHFPTGVSVVAGMHEEEPVGLAIGSFFSVSLEPPMVGFCAGKGSSTWPKLRASGRFCVNILGAHQEELCRVFASGEPKKFDGVGWDASPLGSPRILDTIAWIDCEIDAVHDAGDHEIVVAIVHDLAVTHEGHPLVYFRGGYADLA